MWEVPRNMKRRREPCRPTADDENVLFMHIIQCS
jgi:hypothetical protein